MEVIRTRAVPSEKIEGKSTTFLKKIELE